MVFVSGSLHCFKKSKFFVFFILGNLNMRKRWDYGRCYGLIIQVSIFIFMHVSQFWNGIGPRLWGIRWTLTPSCNTSTHWVVTSTLIQLYAMQRLYVCVQVRKVPLPFHQELHLHCQSGMSQYINKMMYYKTWFQDGKQIQEFASKNGIYLLSYLVWCRNEIEYSAIVVGNLMSKDGTM